MSNISFKNKVLTEQQVKTKIDTAKNEIRRIGYQILSEEFIDAFYGSAHSNNTEWFERDILNILHCNINFKEQAIRARTEVFLRESIVSLINFWNEYREKETK